MIPYSIKVIAIDNKKLNSNFPLRLRVIINRKKCEYWLNIDVKNLTDFDSTKQLIKSSMFNADNYNKIIKKTLQKAQQYFLDCDLREIPYSIEGFKLYYLKSEKSLNDFYVFAEKAIEEIKGLVCYDSLRQFKGEITKLKKFKPSLYLHEIKW